MGRFLRYLLIAVVAFAALAPTAAYAGCMTDPTSCMSPPPSGSAPPKTPAPTAKPTTKPAPPAPTHHYVPPVNNNTGSTSSVDNSTPEPTPFPVDVSPVPAATTVIETQQLPGDNSQTLESQNASSSSGLIVGLIVGLIIGFLIGRASWGIKRRRRQQIFG